MASTSSITQRWNDRVEIAHGDSAHATYRVDPNLPKACVHPLYTAGGTMLTGFEMSDHVWHRGLWFTIKFINGENFWEEPNGMHVSRAQPACQIVAPDVVRLTHHVEWTSQSTGKVLEEKRVLTFRSDIAGARAIDWYTELRATKDLKLDRTPFTTWGGYGGLAYRASRELHDVSFLIASGETVASSAGNPGDWAVMQGSVDGGANRKVSVGFIDHPANPRSPCPWYFKSGNGFNFINAAFLFHEPMDLAREQTLKFNYRMIYCDRTWTRDEFAELADDFRRTPGEDKP